MTDDHIVILKKIPVDPKHLGALRLHREVGSTHHHTPLSHTKRDVSRGRDTVSSPAVYRIFSFLLFCAFLINPIGVAYAEEVTPLPDVPTDAAPSAEATPPAPEPGVTIVVPPSEETADIPPPATSETLGGGEGGALPATEETGTSTDSAPSEEETATSTDDVHAGDTPLPEEESSTSTASSTDEVEIAQAGGGQQLISSSTDETATTTDETASSTDETALPTEKETAENLNREQTPEERAAERAVAEAVMREQIKKEVEAEMRSRCVSYGDDGYYCLDDSSATRVMSVTPVEQVISVRDAAGGDKEIVLVRTLPEGESRESLTQNDFDDEFPSSDGEMRMIVWQANVGGRWQIAYKETAGTIEYLTANADGNGHPATDGKHIVWQGWSGSHWDIFLAEPGDGSLSFSTSTGGVLEGIHPGWTVRQLSHSPSHAMFPKIAGNFVTWQEHRGETWVIVVYDLSTGQSRVIEGESGGTGEAPTLALIFKERTKEGRILIHASDLATGQRIPLRDDEIPLPAKLPIPEQSGALPLQSGTSTTSVRPEGDGDAGGTPTL